MIGNTYSGLNNFQSTIPMNVGNTSMNINNYKSRAAWQPGAETNNAIIQQKQITSNWKYRKFLTDNADSFIEVNQVEACNQCCSNPIQHSNNNNISATPFIYNTCCDTSQPFGYDDSDMKDSYISQYQTQCKMSTPTISKAQLMNR